MLFYDLLIAILSYGTFLADALIVIFLLYFFGKKNLPLFLKKNSLLFAFLIALFGTLGSLFFSEVMNYAPCTLCWYQRVFMYPLVVLFGVGLVRKSKNIADYGIVLSIFGGLFSLYHSFIQAMSDPGICGEGTVDCIQKYIYGYGFMSIPIMTLTAFVLVIILCFIWRGYVRENLQRI